MSGFVDSVLNVDPRLALIIVGLLVFAEDALFVGFVVPGETAAVLGGVVASRGVLPLWSVMVVVVLAAIIGDSAGYEVGRHLGPRLLSLNVMNRRLARLEKAQEFLRLRGGSAVFLGRFVAFFRAVMPALAGSSRMPYLKFLAFNAAGGLVWGAGFVLLGYLAGNSYDAAATTAGRGVTAVVAVVVVAAVITWRVRKARATRNASARRNASGEAGAGQSAGRPEQ
ncbi:DedA family protein [Arthrobacter sp. 9MFCol3.1]|uniref:DedA family protein n=1 Tax=Arthrobacter sp. 9MFCol3.1 TaxID=1150398 RepID=UPI00047B25C3|nr:DedA family protein [Arthrobacter sp. 9MFCol3.1]